MDTKESIWYQMTKDYKLGATKQGLARRTGENGLEYDVPHMSYSADLDYLDTEQYTTLRLQCDKVAIRINGLRKVFS